MISIAQKVEKLGYSIGQINTTPQDRTAAFNRYVRTVKHSVNLTHNLSSYANYDTLTLPSGGGITPLKVSVIDDCSAG